MTKILSENDTFKSICESRQPDLQSAMSKKRKSITPSKINRMLIDDPNDPDDPDSKSDDSAASSESPSSSSSESMIMSPAGSETISSQTRKVIPPPAKPPAKPPGTTPTGTAKPPSATAATAKAKSRLPLPPVPIPDWAKVNPPSVVRSLDFTSDDDTTSPPKAKPVDPATDSLIPLVDITGERTDARRKERAASKSRQVEAVYEPRRLSSALKRKRPRKERYSDEDSFDDDVRDKSYRVAGVREEKDTSISSSESESDTDTGTAPAPREREREMVAVARASAATNVPALHPLDKDGKGSAIWYYFKKVFKRGPKNQDIQYAVCQIRYADTGKICGKELAQPLVSTIGPRQHMSRRHQVQWAEVKAIDKTRKQVKAGMKRTLEDIQEALEGENFNTHNL